MPQGNRGVSGAIVDVFFGYEIALTIRMGGEILFLQMLCNFSNPESEVL